MKKLLSFLLSLTLLSLLAFPAHAAEAASAFEEKRLALEEKYNINILYDLNTEGEPAIGTGSLSTLDIALSKLSPALVKRVSAFYEEEVGTRLSFYFHYSPFHEAGSDFEVLGSFRPAAARVELYIPSSSQGVFTTGASPLTIVHEFGHAFLLMAEYQRKDNSIQQSWLSFNEGVGYGSGYSLHSNNRLVFISSYASTDFREDFAETFSHAFVRHNAGQGITHLLAGNDQPTSLGKKVAYVEELVAGYMGTQSAAVQNLQRVYSAPSSTYYGNLRLSGDDLQFVGCPAPLYVRKGILSLINLTESSSEWVYDIGAWQVTTTSGETLLVFPGGRCERLTGSQAAA